MEAGGLSLSFVFVSVSSSLALPLRPASTGYCVCCITKKRRREGYCVTAVRRNRLPASASRGMIERALLAVLAGLWGSRPGNADGDLTALPIVAIFAHPYNDRCGGVQAVVCRKEMHVCTSVPNLRTGSSFLNGAEGTFCVLRC